MRVLILTSRAGTAHQNAANALVSWFGIQVPHVDVTVLFHEDTCAYNSDATNLYNWIQKKAPWLHKIYWRILETEDFTKPGTVLIGRGHFVEVLRRCLPDLLISTHPHTNRGHFDLAKRVVGPQLRCIVCCTEVDGGFGFTRNWVTRTADGFWAITEPVAAELRKRLFPEQRIAVLGPLLQQPFHAGGAAPLTLPGLPLLVLGSGANGSGNHLDLLEQLLPWGGQLEVVALCGHRKDLQNAVQHWAESHPGLAVTALDFQGPEAMAALYRRCWAMVSRPGARTATEALLLGCPLIFHHLGGCMPQELLALRYFRERGLATSIQRACDLAAVVGGWLADPARYQLLRLRYRQCALQADPERVMKYLLHG
ncbi:hypothetical protein KQ313_11025 [Synechococcus sp. CS-1325]|uniref:glycosyltransferase n=1 Tax=unclassified Synechococcus TaxID=2626047 RepID=UPI000DAFE9E0|nr:MULTISPECIES: glycosyltransferase [unclassified Synechococcus]MCT0200211.1 hypothetical protein [Synechococcus sp. CS-1325]MCT0213184.1 hypothetical protein [Synechococcus sp. CS-1326]MCT0233345.1 hypothetical protein [Synechococcus sp. CS-1327]PZU97565.1 MAG: hypothetical protein DCF24_12140 [Cyanobium sp.]